MNFTFMIILIIEIFMAILFIIYDHFFVCERSYLAPVWKGSSKHMWERAKNNGEEGGGLSIL